MFLRPALLPSSCFGSEGACRGVALEGFQKGFPSGVRRRPSRLRPRDAHQSPSLPPALSAH
eukprot:4546413-Alexandrium_andersonii.AAC.1